MYDYDMRSLKNRVLEVKPPSRIEVFQLAKSGEIRMSQYRVTGTTSALW
jgi:hypothetical protein